jgi:Fur family zinc uptake transcriptional regulator
MASSGNATLCFAGKHDHGLCMVAALETAERLCSGRGARLTKLRRRVLELVWASHVPVGAYDLLRRLGREHDGAAPPTVYRALEFLLEQGLIHRIESLNGYVGCVGPGRAHAGQFLICRDCGSALELSDPRIDRAITKGAAEQGFAVERKTVEVAGVCPDCRPAAEGDGRDG